MGTEKSTILPHHMQDDNGIEVIKTNRRSGRGEPDGKWVRPTRNPGMRVIQGGVPELLP